MARGSGRLDALAAADERAAGAVAPATVSIAASFARRDATRSVGSLLDGPPSVLVRRQRVARWPRAQWCFVASTRRCGTATSRSCRATSRSTPACSTGSIDLPLVQKTIAHRRGLAAATSLSSSSRPRLRRSRRSLSSRPPSAVIRRRRRRRRRPGARPAGGLVRALIVVVVLRAAS